MSLCTPMMSTVAGSRQGLREATEPLKSDMGAPEVTALDAARFAGLGGDAERSR